VAHRSGGEFLPAIVSTFVRRGVAIEFDSVSTHRSIGPVIPRHRPRLATAGPFDMTATPSEGDDTLTDSRFAQLLRLLKLVLTVLMLVISLWEALGSA